MSKAPFKHLTLDDGSGYIFRAYFAIPPRSNSGGIPTNATFGFTNMLIKLLRDSDAEALATRPAAEAAFARLLVSPFQGFK